MTADTADTGPRTLGVIDQGRPGPTLVVLSAVHGNEPAGVAATERVLARLEERRQQVAGRLVGLVGNPSALACGRRFQKQDLNRLWSVEALSRLADGDAAGDGPEEHECRELFTILESEGGDPRRELILLDLHSTSAHGSPFTCISDALGSRELALALPVPLVLGIEEAIKGSLLDYMEERGRPAIAFEGGQHADPATIDNHEAAIWLTLVSAGLLDEGDVPELPAYRDRLEHAAADTPAVVEVVHRHPVRDSDGFAMLPGFRNFETLRRGQLLANDRGGPVRSPSRGLVLMPLYQGQGDDGFFIVRRVAKGWLAVSSVLRRVRAGWLLEHLPGVRRVPARPDLLLVNPSIARAFPVQLFHLAGYRRLPSTDGELLFTRRNGGRGRA